MNIISRTLLLGLILLLGFQAVAQQTKDSVKIDLKNEAQINTNGLEFSPTFYEDGIIFISTNPAGLKKVTDAKLKKPAMSILRSRRDAEGSLMPPQPFSKEISTAYHQGPVCFDRTAETVYFSSNVLEKGRPKFAKDGIQKMRLYSSTKTGETWSAPQALPFNQGEFNDGHPAISIDGDKLYFASDRPGGLGGYDLYVSYRVGQSWSEPVNLGDAVNTKANEVFPFIHADNTLYFSSNGYGGAGGLDLVYAIPDGASWTKPVNMGSPFNTSSDDFGLIVDLDKINGYFNSDGREGAGGDDIYSFHTENGNLDDYLSQENRVPARDLDLLVVVTEKLTGKPVSNTAVKILNMAGANVIGKDEMGNLITVQNEDGKDVMKSASPEPGIEGLTDKLGEYRTIIKPGNYAISVSRDGFQTKQLQYQAIKPGNELKVVIETVFEKVQWNATVYNYVTNAPLTGAKLVLTNKNTGAKDSVIVDARGEVNYYLERNTKYDIDMYQGNRLIGSTEIDTEAWSLPNQIMMQTISLAPMLAGSVIELPNIYYNFNDATLRPDARKDMVMIASLMKQYPAIHIELASHTDSRGTDAYNQDLSQRRANGVVEYLVSKGVDSSRLKAMGYGESQPRNQCADGVGCPEREHARNRRTEIRITSGAPGASLVYMDGKPTGTQVVSLGDLPAQPPTESKMEPELKPKSADKPADAQSAEAPKVNVAPDAAAEVTVAAPSGSGFYVVAGSFAKEARAQAHLGTIKTAGFPDAEIIQFPNSPYFSVVVGKFENRPDADALKQKLADSNLQAFVRIVSANQ